MMQLTKLSNIQIRKIINTLSQLYVKEDLSWIWNEIIIRDSNISESSVSPLLTHFPKVTTLRKISSFHAHLIFVLKLASNKNTGKSIV